MKAQRALEAIAQAFAVDTIGQAFFEAFSEYLAQALDVSYVFIGELVEGEVRSLVFLAHGREIGSITYPLVGSLCEQVVQAKSLCAFPRNVQQQFPANQALKRLGVDSYVGLPLVAASGRVIGLLYVMDQGPVQDLDKTQLLLTILAKRAALELERQQQERALLAKNQQLEAVNHQLRHTQQALEESNQALEATVEGRTRALLDREASLKASLEQVTSLNHTLRQREAFLSRLVSSTSVGIAQTDLSGRFTFANEGYQHMVGRSLEELRGLTLMDITHPQDLPRNQLLLERLREVGQSFELEKRYLRPDGSIPWIHISVSLVATAEDQPAHLMAVCQEVTLRKRAEQALQASEQQLRLITNALPVLISFVDDQQRYRFVNQTYQAWFGEPIASLQGKTLREVLGPAAYELILPRVRKVLAGEEQHFEADVDYRRVGIRFVEVHYLPHWQTGRVVGFYALVTDITARKQTEQALEQAVAQAGLANQRLSRINADLDGFVYTASHDLRSPVASMQGLVDLIQSRLADQLTGQDQVLLQHLSTSMGKLKRTMTDLSEIVQASTDTSQPAEAIGLADLFLEVKEDLAPLLESGQASIVTEWGVEALHYPRKVLRSVLFNLLSNAVKYRHPNRASEIRLKTEREAGQFHLSVADNGLGLTGQQVGNLFKLFKRLHDHVEGTGVGLYTIKRMVENYEGSIWVESTPGVGTIFHVHLPFRNG